MDFAHGYVGGKASAWGAANVMHGGQSAVNVQQHAITAWDSSSGSSNIERWSLTKWPTHQCRRALSLPSGWRARPGAGCAVWSRSSWPVPHGSSAHLRAQASTAGSIHPRRVSTSSFSMRAPFTSPSETPSNTSNQAQAGTPWQRTHLRAGTWASQPAPGEGQSCPGGHAAAPPGGVNGQMGGHGGPVTDVFRTGLTVVSQGHGPGLQAGHTGRHSAQDSGTRAEPLEPHLDTRVRIAQGLRAQGGGKSEWQGQCQRQSMLAQSQQLLQVVALRCCLSRCCRSHLQGRERQVHAVHVVLREHGQPHLCSTAQRSMHSRQW